MALAEIRERIRAARAERRSLRLVGGGTKDFYGGPPAGEPLALGAHRGIVSYEPTELVVTARCGTPLLEVQAALAERGQMLAFEPPAFGDGATIGGVVAAGLSGPRRAAAGALRDFVLGATLLDANGESLRFGGQVMKNVAGYDIARLLAGSLGVLGVIEEVSLKVLPVPPAERTLRMAMSQAQALEQLNRWGGQPWPISASSFDAGTLRLRLSGARAAVDAAVRRFADEQGAREVDGDEALAYWSALREHALPFFAGEGALWRLSVPSTAAALSLPGRQLLEWGGALRWLKLDAGAAVDAQALRAQVAAAGGAASRFRGGDPAQPAFEPPSAPILAVHQRLKAQFDPDGIFNPGRLFAGL